MPYILYQFLGQILFILAFPVAYLFLGILGGRRQEFRQRLGHLDVPAPDPDRPVRIWLHAASVGEVQVARTLVAEIAEQLPEAHVVVSTMTRQGFLVAQSQMPPEVLCFFAPLDLRRFVDRALAAIRPDVYVCLETELWPNMIRQAYRKGVKLFLLNGRISKRSFSRYLKIRGFMEEILSCFITIAVIQGSDGKRFRALGADPARIRILGNAKYDRVARQADRDCADRYRKLLQLRPDQPVLVAGSTHTGEEEILVNVAQTVKQRVPDLVLLLAPRHQERLGEVEALLEKKGLPFDRLSRIQTSGRNSDLVLVDGMGELADLYSVARYVFCGGSLVDRGGHNVLEAAAWGHPVFYGPCMDDFCDAQALLESERAGFCVKNQEELTGMLLHFVSHPEEYALAARAAMKIAGRQRDSARKQIALIKEVLHRT